MNTLLTNKETKASPKAGPGLALLLIALFLLTTCPIKETLSLLLVGKTTIENFGLNDIKNVSENRSNRVAGNKVCSATEVNSENVETPSRLSSSTFMSAGLVILFLLPAFSFRSLLLKGLPKHYSTATFSSGLSPIYIRNRRLLI